MAVLVLLRLRRNIFAPLLLSDDRLDKREDVEVVEAAEDAEDGALSCFVFSSGNKTLVVGCVCSTSDAASAAGDGGGVTSVAPALENSSSDDD